MHYSIKQFYRDDKITSFFLESTEKIKNIFKTVPYLNGGLFECLDKEDTGGKVIYVDGFSREKERRAFIPNSLFFDEDTGILPLLKRYNFTVEESTPQDIDVALDPELLGKIFENLLGAYNPETKETARKQSGSFYTPREIVSYMVDESLKAYLKEKCPQISRLDADKNDVTFGALFSANMPTDFSDAECNWIIDALLTAKILDPACGSGAFPMSILNRMVDLLKKLYPENTQRNTGKLYNLKLKIIENCIYGVDIQSIAVQISKLRVFISLIVDQERDDTQANSNYGILSLPNLETRFVAANTLIGLEKSVHDALELQDENLKQLENELFETRIKSICPNNRDEKNDLRKKDAELCEKIQKYLMKNVCKPNEELIKIKTAEIETLTKKIADLPEEWGEEGAANEMFDDIAKQALFRVDKNEDKRNECLAAIKTLQREIASEQAKSAFAGLDKEIKKILSWNPYDQMQTSPFFDAHWMFGVADGFDVVIGNPPYVQIKQIPWDDRRNFEKIYKFATGRFNLFYLFLERSAELTKKNGLSVYIVPDRLMLNTQCGNLRDFLLNVQTLIELDSFDESVFESAVVDSVIVMYKNIETIYKTVKAKNKSNIHTIGTDKYKTIPIEHFTTSPSNQFDLAYDANVEIIINKIRRNAVLLGDIADVKDGIIQSKIPDELFLKKQKNAKCKKLLFGKDISRYNIVFSDNWINYDTVKMKVIEVERCGEGKPIGLRLRVPEIFERNKILTRQTADKIIACFDTDNYYYANTLHGTTITDLNYLPKYVLAILNSKLITWYYRTITAEEGKVFAQIKIELLKLLPIHTLKKEQQKPFIALVDQIIEAKGRGEETAELEEEIDTMVYGVYGLRKEEVRVVERKE